MAFSSPRDLIRRISAALLSLGLIAAVAQGCQKSHFSGSSDSPAESGAGLNMGGGDGMGFEGRVQSYLWVDPLSPCADGLSNAQIVRNATLRLVRTDCATLAVPQLLAPTDVQDDPNGGVLFQGKRFVPAPVPAAQSASVNLLTASQDFSSSVWTQLASSISGAGATVSSPSGTPDAAFLQEDTSAGAWHYVEQHPAYAYQPGSTMTFSVYARSGSRHVIFLQIQDATVFRDQNDAWFDLSAGTVALVMSHGQGSGATASITPVGNGWYRLAVSGIPSTQYTNLEVDIDLEPSPIANVYTGDGQSGAYIWGAQLETGSSASSYTSTQ